MARLTHLPQYKDKSAKMKDEKIPLGLFLYPVLQAADIMLHKWVEIVNFYGFKSGRGLFNSRG